MVDSALPPPVQGSGNWQGYVGPGASNLSDPARYSAMSAAGNQATAFFQLPQVSDFYNEMNKYITAFSQPRVDVPAAPSQAYQDIVNQYNQQHYQVATGGGSYSQWSTNPQPTQLIQNPRNAAEIAYNVAITNGIQNPELAQKAMSYGFRPEWLGQVAESGRSTVPSSAIPSASTPYNAPSVSTGPANFGVPGSMPNIYTEQALQQVQGRAGYNTSLGDLTTQNIMNQYSSAQRMLGIMGMNIAEPNLQTGRVLEAQRMAAPTAQSQQFYTNELQKWAQNQVELGSAYHAIGMRAGVPIPANPFEYTADLAVEFLKGTPQTSSQRFSPVSGEMSAYLPGGTGLQESAWQVAKSGTPSTQSYGAAIEKLIGSTGQYGPYGALWGGPAYRGTGRNAPQSPMAPAAVSIPQLRSAGIPGVYLTREVRLFEPEETPFTPASTQKDWLTQANEYVGSVLGLRANAAEPVATEDTMRYMGPEVVSRMKTTQTATPAAFGFGTITGGLENLNKQVREFLHLPSVEIGERATTAASLTAFPLLPLTLPGAIETATSGKTTTTEILNPFSGQYKQFYEQPLLVPVSYGIGAGFGTIAKGVESAYIASRSAAAERIISSGSIARGAEQFGGFVMSRAPVVLGGLYAADIGLRATEGGKTFAPEIVLPTARGIITQEAVPMGAGFALPGQIITGAKTLQFGYKDIQQNIASERSAAYGIKTLPSEVSFSDVIEYKYGPKFAEFKIGALETLSGRAPPDIATIARPAQLGFGENPIFKIRSTISESINRPVAPEVSRTYYSYEGIESTAYPKAPRLSGQDILATGYSKYFNIRSSVMGAFEKAPNAEIVRTNVAPENEFAFTYPKTDYTLETGSVTSRLTKLIPSTTFGEVPGLPSITTTQRPEYGFSSTRGKPPSGGSGERFRTTSLGTGLAKEPSLKTLGINERGIPSEAQRPIGQRTDFRGRPISERMKPMSSSEVKQASGASLLTEQLPRIEGMPESRIMPPAERMFIGAPSLAEIKGSRQGLVQIITPRLEFSQEQRRRQEQSIMLDLEPIGKTAQIAEHRRRSETMFVSDILPRTRQEQFVTQVPGIITRQGISQEQRRTIVPSFDYSFDTRTRLRTDTGIRQGMEFDQILRQTQRTEQPQQTRITYRYEIPPTPVIPPLTLPPSLPGTVPGSGFPRGYRKFTEYLSFGGLGFSGRMSVGTNARRIKKIKARKKK